MNDPELFLLVGCGIPSIKYSTGSRRSKTVPVIVESRVEKEEVDEEIQNAPKALSFENVLALAGD